MSPFSADHREEPYAFRRRLNIVHHPDRRDPASKLTGDEFRIDTGWTIVVSKQATPLILNVAKDLQDYLLVSMDESVRLERVEDIVTASQDRQQVIILATRAELGDDNPQLSVPRAYRLSASPECIVVCGADDRGVGQGSYFLEDLMNLREAPFLQPQELVREPLFSPRMTHSGWGLDDFPDSHLNAIAHAGMDSILVFVTGVDRTPDEHTHHQSNSKMGATGRYQDFNNLIDRAERYGLDVYFYAYFRNLELPHPSAPGAEQSYERAYGDVFRACPRAKGIVLVGESVEFPSHDPRTTGQLRGTPTPDGLPATKPTPGWWPCADYPEWLNLVKSVVRKHSPNADIVFWTYNWGYAPEDDRLELIRSLPTDITLLVTFEMFEPIERAGIKQVCVDYTASFVGPGRYFVSEAKVAHERGLRLYTMCNTGGLTWDFGVIPYEPIPFQWARRHAALRDAHEAWGLSGLMESHHFGWWPSFVSELAKWSYWTPSPSTAETCEALAKRDYGAAAAQSVLAAWQAWSEAILDYVPTNEDQYGPFRIGPSYPLMFHARPVFPTASHAMFGDRIFHIDYKPQVSSRALKQPGPVRIDAEIKSLQRMAQRWERGITSMETAMEQVPDRKLPDAKRQLGLARFILHSVHTTIHTKEWWKLRHAVFGASDPVESKNLLGKMTVVAEEEVANAEATIPIVEADSRLGWEPSMEYVGDAAHLRWKIAQVRHVIDHEIPAYRAALERVTSRSN